MIDHLVYATPDLLATMVDVERGLGITPVIGGRHPGRGTWNALISLRPEGDSISGAYLELIGPDPEQPEPDQPRPFGVDQITQPTLVAWAARTADIERTVTAAIADGHEPGPVMSMQRETPEGDLLRWQLTFPLLAEFNGAVPFLIDWGTTTHPSLSTPHGAQLVSFSATHPRVATINTALAALGVRDDLLVVYAAVAALHATVQSTFGELRL